MWAAQVIDYRTEDVGQRASRSRWAPYAVVLDCVGGKDLIPYLDELILHDPSASHLGIYVTIVGDSTSIRPLSNRLRLLIGVLRQRRVETPWEEGSQMFDDWLILARCSVDARLTSIIIPRKRSGRLEGSSPTTCRSGYR